MSVTNMNGAPSGGLDIASNLPEDIKALKTPDFVKGVSTGNANFGSFGSLGSNASLINKGTDLLVSFIKNRPEYSGKYGNITKSMDNAYNAVQKAVSFIPGWGLIASIAMGAGKVLNKAVGRIGGGTDGVTRTDAILGSNFLGLTPMGLINGFGGSKAYTYTRNSELDKSTNGGYVGFLTSLNLTEANAGKKYGLFSSGARHKQNRLNEFTTNMKHSISSTVDTNTINTMAALGSTPFLNLQQLIDLNGGVQQMQAAKHGMKLVPRYLTGSYIPSIPYRTIDDEEIDRQISYEPVITLELEPTYFTSYIPEQLEKLLTKDDFYDNPQYYYIQLDERPTEIDEYLKKFFGIKGDSLYIGKTPILDNYLPLGYNENPVDRPSNALNDLEYGTIILPEKSNRMDYGSLAAHEITHKYSNMRNNPKDWEEAKEYFSNYDLVKPFDYNDDLGNPLLLNSDDRKVYDKAGIDYSNIFPGYSNVSHDNNLGEHIADLGSLVWTLYKMGIFDANTPDAKISIKDLQEYDRRKLLHGTKLDLFIERLRKSFSDEQIINALNHIIKLRDVLKGLNGMKMSFLETGERSNDVTPIAKAKRFLSLYKLPKGFKNLTPKHFGPEGMIQIYDKQGNPTRGLTRALELGYEPVVGYDGKARFIGYDSNPALPYMFAVQNKTSYKKGGQFAKRIVNKYSFGSWIKNLFKSKDPKSKEAMDLRFGYNLPDSELIKLGNFSNMSTDSFVASNEAFMKELEERRKEREQKHELIVSKALNPDDPRVISMKNRSFTSNSTPQSNPVQSELTDFKQYNNNLWNPKNDTQRMKKQWENALKEFENWYRNWELTDKKRIDRVGQLQLFQNSAQTITGYTPTWYGQKGMLFSRKTVSKYQMGNKLNRSILTIDIATGKYVYLPIGLTKEQISGQRPIRLANGTAVFMLKNGTVTSDRWETPGTREHLTPKGLNGMKLSPLEMGEEPIGYSEDGTPLYKKGDGSIGPLTEENIGKENLFKLIEQSDANFAKRLRDPNRKAIKLADGNWGNFKLSWSEDEYGVMVYPEILEIDGQLVDLSNDREAAWKSAVERGDYVYFPSREAAEWFTTHYKQYYKGFDKFTIKGQSGLKFYKHWKKPSNWSETKIPYKEWIKDIKRSEYLNDNYDLELAYYNLPKEELERWKFAVNSENPEYYLDYTDVNGNYIYHLPSVVEFPNSENYIFLKKGTLFENPELLGEIDSYYNGENGLKSTHNLVYNNGRYYYIKPTYENRYFVLNISEYKEGGQMNVIPEGALHARLNHMKDVDEDLAKSITHKGIPVITEEKDGEIVQHAEIEHSEIIFTLDVTNKLEDLRKKYHEENKDEYAIEAGKLLVNEILHNTDDRVNLIKNIE